MASFYYVARALSTGCLDVAEERIREGFELGSAAQHPATGPIFWGQTLWLAQERGDVEWLARAIDAMSWGDWVPDSTSPILDGLLAFHDLLRDRREDARRVLHKMPVERLNSLPRDEHWLTAMTSFAEIAARLGEREHAQALYALLLPYAHLNAAHDLLRTDRGAVAYYLGMLASILDRPVEAVTHFESALEMNARMGARAHVARTRADYAAFLLRGDRAGDHARARELHDAARRTASELGLRGLEKRLAGATTEGG